MNKHLSVESLKMPFQELLNLVDTVLKNDATIKISNKLINQKLNNGLFLKWLKKHNFITFNIEEKVRKRKKKSIRSRQRKIEVSLQLKALGFNISEISSLFKVSSKTVQGYLKALNQYDHDYLRVLELGLAINKITKTSSLDDFLEFPIRIEYKEFKNRVSSRDFSFIEDIIKKSKWLQVTAGQTLGTSNISILFPIS